jgi:hypothetical protein
MFREASESTGDVPDTHIKVCTRDRFLGWGAWSLVDPGGDA